MNNPYLSTMRSCSVTYKQVAQSGFVKFLMEDLFDRLTLFSGPKYLNLKDHVQFYFLHPSLGVFQMLLV